MLGEVRDRVAEALLKLGDRAETVLRAALEVSEARADPQLGDFDYRSVAERLRSSGMGDPKMVLRVLERDFGVIETSYHSYNQHWWKFVDRDQVIEALGETSMEDPEVQLVRIQFNSLGVEELERKLRFMATKPTITDSDRRSFRELAFDVLPSLTELYRRASVHESTAYVCEEVLRIMNLANVVSKRMSTKRTPFGQLNSLGQLKEPLRDEPQGLVKD
ncbi:hypothetical protein HS1genome_1437 [Sulfodiicoccus acidiphilus]|uniref:Uncharacterized protein n=1 Tax=Sulfodiicoccus acidiphilus TaxID=1670455 RepID=A0A348B4E6_9CREN|nr:hypothetical protein [Sulfodiicoccus acidiphilus]BBD73048.1 hypothetical protein HS1genome_1437 [Sulfodiicoccus acidiphilus]GGU03879.1 hypothetical protein GCM10007116_20850 [Sulfodiicoccus acidiphilus]